MKLFHAQREEEENTQRECDKLRNNAEVTVNKWEESKDLVEMLCTVHELFPGYLDEILVSSDSRNAAILKAYKRRRVARLHRSRPTLPHPEQDTLMVGHTL